MKELASLLVWLFLFQPTLTHHDIDQEFNIQEFKRAVVDAFNTSKTFSQNFYELLGLICPESVYCQTNGTFDTEDAEFRNTVTEEILDTGEFLKNYNHTAITDARNILQRNAHHLPGCCERCSCRNDCRERNTCCPSMGIRKIDADSFNSSALAKQECVYANSKYYTLKSTEYSFSETVGVSFFMVTDCAQVNVSKSIAAKCTKPDPEKQNETSPVFSTTEKKIYRNEFCARCNDISPVTLILPLITIKQFLSFTGEYRLPSSPGLFYRTAINNARFFDVAYPFPTGSLNINDFGCIFRPTSFGSDNSICDANPNLDNNQKYFFRLACAMKQHLYHTDRRHYKNVFCFLCDWKQQNYKPACVFGGESSSKNSKDSYSVLLGIPPDSSIQPEEISKTKSFCNCAELFDASKKECRELLCPPGEMRDVCDCVPFITNITGRKIKLDLEILPQLPDSVAKKRFGVELQNNVSKAMVKAVRRLVASEFGPLISDTQYLFRTIDSKETSPFKFHYCQILTWPGGSDYKKKFENMFKTLNAGLTQRIVGNLMDISLGLMVDIKPFETIEVNTKDGKRIVLEPLYPEDYLNSDSGRGDPLQAQPLKKLVYCKRIKLEDKEVDMLHNVTAVRGWPKTYLDYVFWEEDGSMCLEDFEAAFLPNNTSGSQSYIYLTTKNDVLVHVTVAWLVFCEASLY